jgi:UDPglucose 6-dehydrogenase
MSIEKAAIIGLGKLGAPFAAAIAAKGIEVVGVDVLEHHVRCMNEGEAPIFEPGLPELLKEAKDRLSATHDTEAAVLASDATFIIVPTPSDRDGGFSLKYTLPVCEEIGRALAKKDAYHLVTMTSTVLPGDCETRIIAALEEASGKKVGVDFGFCYSPEFIALGTVIRDFLNPDFLLIGEHDEKAGTLLADFYTRVCENDAQAARMNIVNAEIAKIALNSFVTTKITFANSLARICEHIPGADAWVVTDALGMDSRIGPKYLRGALGYGGPCFPRDNAAFAHMAKKHGSKAPLAETVDHTNRDQVGQLSGLLQKRMPAGARVGILGLSYKPGSDVIEESQSILLAAELADAGHVVWVHDPRALENARGYLGERVQYAENAAECIKNADAVVVATPWPDYAALSESDFSGSGQDLVVVDCWRALNPERFSSDVKIQTLGQYWALNGEEKNNDG